LRRFGRGLGWFVVVEALITTFGLTTTPLLVLLAADAAVVVLLIRSCLAPRRCRESAA
jgi:hypothetical protein